MPLPELQDMLEVANVIESRERLAAIVDGQVASGVAKNARSHIRVLNRSAAFSRPRPASAGDLSSLGIEVVRG